MYLNQVLDCRKSCAVTFLLFLLPDGVVGLSHPSHRIDLAGHQQKCQSHLIPHKSSATCFGTPFFKPDFKPIQQSYSQRTKAEFILSDCSYQISRVSNQNWVHLCHDRLWFSGDVCIFGHPASAPSQPVTVSSSATAPSSSLRCLCFSWHSFVRWH